MDTPHEGRPQPAPDDLLDVAEVARLTGTGVRYARTMVYERRLPTVKLGAKVRVRRADLDAYLAEHTRPAR